MAANPSDRTTSTSLIRAGVLALFTAIVALVAILALAQNVQAGPSGGDGHGAGHDKNPSAHFNWTDTDYKTKDKYGGTLESGEESMSPPFALLLMNFAIVLFIVGWKVAPPIKRYARNRHDTIKSDIDKASEVLEEAEKLLKEYRTKGEAAEKEADALIEDIRTSAEAEKERIKKEAEEQAAALQRDADSRIAAELAKARGEIEREVIAAAVAAAEKLIREKTTDDDKGKLVETFLGDMQAEVDAHNEERQ